MKQQGPKICIQSCPLHRTSPRHLLDSDLRIPLSLTRLVLDIKLGMHIAGAHASVVGQDAHEAGGEIAGFVVGVQELDVRADGGGGGMRGSVKTRIGRGRGC